MARVRSHRAEFNREFLRKVDIAFNKIGVLLVGSVKRSMGSGGGSAGTPSAPGQPPNVQTGRLRQSIRHEVEVSPTEVVLRYGTNVEYARRQELGFVGADSLGRVYHQPARPYLRPALPRERNKIRKILRG